MGSPTNTKCRGRNTFIHRVYGLFWDSDHLCFLCIHSFGDLLVGNQHMEYYVFLNPVQLLLKRNLPRPLSQLQQGRTLVLQHKFLHLWTLLRSALFDSLSIYWRTTHDVHLVGRRNSLRYPAWYQQFRRLSGTIQTTRIRLYAYPKNPKIALFLPIKTLSNVFIA